MIRITSSALPEFLSRRRYAVIHVDAKWDGHRHQTVLESGRRDITDPPAERAQNGHPSFGLPKNRNT
jgi:hypothetical protein